MKTLTRQIAEALEEAYDNDQRHTFPFNEISLSATDNKIRFEPNARAHLPKPSSIKQTKCKSFVVDYDLTYNVMDVSEALKNIFTKITGVVDVADENVVYAVTLDREEFETGIVRTLKSNKW